MTQIPVGHVEFLRGLSKEDKFMLTLRDELYVGSWEMMFADLRARLQYKPYNFKIALTIEDDLTRIDRLQRYELKHGVNLSEILDLEPVASA